MRVATHPYWFFLLPCAVFCFQASAIRNLPIWPQSPQSGTFNIQAGSRLYINGSSNVVKFTCDCDCYEPTQSHPFQVQPEADGLNLQFSRTQMRFNTRALDCGHRGINTDMYKTLKAEEYPKIAIEILRTKLPTSYTNTNNTTTAQVLTAITIAGVRRQEWLSVRLQRLAPNQFRFIGAKPLSMSSFGLEAPRPMMGLIQVSDNIEINLDLLIKVSL